MPNDRNEPAAEPTGDEKGPPADLRKASDDLKAKIAERSVATTCPSTRRWGIPNWEKIAADGRLAVRDEERDE